MSFWLFDTATGLFDGRRISTLDLRLPNGFAAVDGVRDWESQRVDMQVYAELQDLERLLEQADIDDTTTMEEITQLKAKLLLDYQPAPPSDEYEWVPDRKRYQLKPEAAEAQRKRSAAESRIAELERQSLRPLRELRVAEVDNAPRPQAAVARLKQIEQEIEALRPDLGAAAQKLNADRG